jgi:hypothetical protein
VAEAIPDSALPFLAAVGRLDPGLEKLLPERDSLQKVLGHLESTTTESSLIEEAFERRRLWQDSGLFYAHSVRFLEAIELFSRLHEKICEARLREQDWLPCGMPLVWIADFYKNLKCPQLAFRYLLLSGISDAIRDKGNVNPNAGFYFRARWGERLSDQEIQQFYVDSFAEYQNVGKYRFFPEYILPKVGHRLTPPYPSPTELNIFAVNRTYAASILGNITQRTEPVDGKDLETLAGYLLGCIPGFEVTMNVVTGESQVDALIRNRGPRYDFREDLGTYFPVECKDWSKPVGSKEVGWFVNKLLTQECKAGILFSSRGITGESAATTEDNVRHAALTLLKAYQRAGRIVIVLSEQDFQAASRGDNLIRLLQKAYEEVRFDIRH